MAYNQDDELAINTIRVLAVSHNPAKRQKGLGRWLSAKLSPPHHLHVDFLFLLDS